MHGYPGGTVTASLGNTTIGSGPITSTSGKAATFTFPVTVPAGAASGTQVNIVTAYLLMMHGFNKTQRIQVALTGTQHI